MKTLESEVFEHEHEIRTLSYSIMSYSKILYSKHSCSKTIYSYLKVVQIQKFHIQKQLFDLQKLCNQKLVLHIQEVCSI